MYCLREPRAVEMVGTGVVSNGQQGTNALIATVVVRFGHGHQLKFDGYRIQAHLLGGRVWLYTRSGLDRTNQFPPIAADVGCLPAEKLVLDGEVISADAKGHPSFSALQDDLKRGRHRRIVYYAFDLLHLDGFRHSRCPIDRAEACAAIILVRSRENSPARPLQRALRGRHEPLLAGQ